MPANRPSVGCTPGRARMFADTVAPVRIGHCGSRRWSVHPTQGTAPADFKIWGTANGARPSPPATTDLVGSGGESDTHAATANPNGYIASWTSRNGGEAYHRLAWRLTRQRFRVRARLVGRTTDFGHGADPSRLAWRAAHPSWRDDERGRGRGRESQRWRSEDWPRLVSDPCAWWRAP